MKRHQRAIAVGLASAGLATACVSMGWVWRRPMWPLPALYLIEAVALPAVVLWTVVFAPRRGACFWAWPALGALATMSLLGAMSVGLSMALALVFLVPASALGDAGRSTVSRKVAGFVLGGLLQGGLMFGIIQYFLRQLP